MNTNHYKKILEDKLKSLQEQQNSIEGQDPYNREGYSDENTQDDDAAEREEHTRADALRTNVQGKIVSIEQALERIEKGTYGYCLNCGEKIDAARLDLLPESEMCINCSQKKI